MLTMTGQKTTINVYFCPQNVNVIANPHDILKEHFHFFIYRNNNLVIFKMGQNIACTFIKKIDDIEEMIMIEKNLSIPFKTMFNNNPCNLPLIIKNKHF